jgi:hypothetical protein
VGLLPRHLYPQDPVRADVARVNALAARLDDGEAVRFLDLGHTFLTPEGHVRMTAMTDFLHPTPEGYGLCVDRLRHSLVRVLGGEGPSPDLIASRTRGRKAVAPGA